MGGRKGASRRVDQAVSPDGANVIDKQRQALELRRKGYSYQEIADELGYKAPNGAHKAVLAGIRKTLQEPADDVIKLELERLDAMFKVVYKKIVNGRVDLIDKGLRIMERRARYLGLDAPTKMVIDWRKELEAEGVDPGEAFEKLVQSIASKIKENAEQVGD